MVAQHVFRDSERDDGEWVVQKWQFQCDVIIEQPLRNVQHWIKNTVLQQSVCMCVRWRRKITVTCVKGRYVVESCGFPS